MMSPEVSNTRGGKERRRRGGDQSRSNNGDVRNASHGGNGSRVRSETMRKVLLGLGFWMQGFRCFPWMGVNFFLKDGLRVDPSTLQILQSSANLPMVAKPFYGILSDSIYISGQHRIPYIAFGAFLQALSWFVLALLSSTISFSTITAFLLLGNLGASIVEVANDAIVAEIGKQPSPSSTSSGELQSFVWMAASLGGILGNLLVGIVINRISAQDMFSLFGVLLSLQFLVTVFIKESTLDLPKSMSNHHGIKKQLSELVVALKKPEISYSIAWFAASFAAVPALTGTMFYYQTQHLKIETSVLGISKVFGQIMMLLWGIIYDKHLKSISPRKLIAGIQVLMAVLMLSDMLFVKGVYGRLGIPESLYVVIFSGFLEMLCFFKILPFSVLMAQLCPPGCEGSVMAFLMSAVALAMVVSGYLGVALASHVKVTSGNDFSGFPSGLLIQAASTLVPLVCSSFIPDGPKPKTS
ncbi:PREDICTED: probable folate-biopterin transporter 7 [Ipomoea nil]|uniref:probable folate-biopterin transporter 7 n=1 Tax=Ipomoea nil TaxID=35883 RepID=UPI00090174DA|nr:PREDICTED: probable folate-biopterin transporter 7 [Ipomoea nil]